MGIPKGKVLEPTVPLNPQSWSLHTMPFLLLGPLPTPERRMAAGVVSVSSASPSKDHTWWQLGSQFSLKRSGTSNEEVTRHPPAILGNEGQQGPSPLTWSQGCLSYLAASLLQLPDEFQ